MNAEARHLAIARVVDAAPSEQGWQEAFAKLDAALAGAGAARIEA